MNAWTLLWRSWRYFRATNLAVIAGVAVATAVLTGALLVGDSVRGSLRDLAVERLGPVDEVIAPGRFFTADLAQHLGANMPGSLCVPALVLRGSASRDDGSAAAAGVQILAVGGSGEAWVKVPPGKVVINTALAEALGVKNGDAIVLSMPNGDPTPRDAALARRGRNDALASLRVEVAGAAVEGGFAGLFDLSPSQRMPRNAWVNLADLQHAVDQPGGANVVLVSWQGRGPEGSVGIALRDSMTLADYGLAVVPVAGGKEAALISRATYLGSRADMAAQDAAESLGVPARRIAVYLLNTVRRDGADAALIHYAIAAGISDLELGDEEVALNAWAAEQLHAQVGDTVRLSYFLRQENGSLQDVEAPRPWRVAKILPMTGVGADPDLTPVYKGFTDTDSVRAWKAPPGFEFHQEWVTNEDETYWQEHRAAPKVFVSMGTARRLWNGPWGCVTSVRVPADKGAAFRQAVLARLHPVDVGMVPRAVRGEQLRAAEGSTDFAMLFAGFSFFLIVAALLLVTMLFRLGVEQRARQLGLLGALGFGPRRLYWLTLRDGAGLAVAGGVLGTFAAIGYTGLMVQGLGTWWIGATGTRHIALHVSAATLAIGLAALLLRALLAMAWSLRHVRQSHAAELLAGGLMSQTTRRGGTRWRLVTAAILTIGGLGLALAGAFGQLSAEAAFLGCGGAVLVASLLYVSAAFRLRRRAEAGPVSVPWLGVRNVRVNPTRSSLTVGLIAFASFILVTVGAMQQGAPANVRARPSGTGGYSLILTADVPLLGDLNTVAGRELVGLRDARAAIRNRARFTALRVWQGQDVSCLNMTRPTAPRIVAVPPSLSDRFVTAQPRGGNALAALDQTTGDNISVVADDDTANYILQLGLGQTLTLPDQTGQNRPLQLTGTLSDSIFQGELLMGETQFAQLFPLQTGAGMVLIEAPAADEADLARLLQTDLVDYGVRVESTGARLAAYKAVANTYLATFQTLGALGLLLGTVGLAVVLLRNLFERRAELALLQALGFGARRRAMLVLLENAWLLVLGLAVGTLAALLGVAPAWRAIDALSLTLTLGGILVFGLAALTLAVALAGRQLTPAALRGE